MPEVGSDLKWGDFGDSAQNGYFLQFLDKIGRWNVQNWRQIP